MATTVLIWVLLFCSTIQPVDSVKHFENVALGKSCTMSSEHSTPHPAGNAVNNDTDADFPDNCIHTGFDDYDPYWEVNLGRPYPVYSITVWAREGFERRMAYIIITVDRQLCYQFPSNTDDWPRKIDITCTGGPLNGSVVRVSKDVRGISQSLGDETINLCEFQVLSCSARFWGSGCDHECSECRDGAACDKVTGSCDSGCKNAGLQPPLCTQECLEAKYGPNCVLSCSSNCADVCDKVTGQCTCEPGWNPPVCQNQCEAGRYGSNCEECGACSGGAPCHPLSGSCERCEDNYKMPLCQECAGGLYGANCSEVCGYCENMDDCQNDTGLCIGGCQEGFTGNMCTEADGNIALPIVLTLLGVGVAVMLALVIPCRWNRAQRAMLTEPFVSHYAAADIQQQNVSVNSEQQASSSALDNPTYDTFRGEDNRLLTNSSYRKICASIASRFNK